MEMLDYNLVINQHCSTRKAEYFSQGLFQASTGMYWNIPRFGEIIWVRKKGSPLKISII